MRLRAERLALHTRRQFVISRTAYTEHVNVVVSLETNDGVVGCGEAAPNRFYEETADTALAAVTRLAGVLRDADEWGIGELEARLAEEAPQAASVRAALSAALHDILGKRLGAPVYRIFGLDPERAPLSSFTIAIAPAAELRQRILDAADYPLLKIKLGTDRDEEIVRTVRETAPGKRLFVDANASWSAERAVRMIELLAELGVELVEQPLAKDDVEGHAWVRARSAIPIIADESCATAADIPGLAGAVDGINIKLAKCGSLREAMRMVHVARAHQLSVMAGCMIESSLGISAIAQIAPLLDYADLDGAALLADDPFSGVQMVAGRLRFTDEPGLGCSRNTAVSLPDHHGREVQRARAG
ncbi:MAG TPA: dipeptide epimerase [Gemmatimonadaceae bacterium]|nr:dipeptide epimerase [Gemmatimonadaceae bacterium]